jgi:hypothetical protein
VYVPQTSVQTLACEGRIYVRRIASQKDAPLSELIGVASMKGVNQ